MDGEQVETLGAQLAEARLDLGGALFPRVRADLGGEEQPIAQAELGDELADHLLGPAIGRGGVDDGTAELGEAGDRGPQRRELLRTLRIGIAARGADADDRDADIGTRNAGGAQRRRGAGGAGLGEQGAGDREGGKSGKKGATVNHDHLLFGPPARVRI